MAAPLSREHAAGRRPDAVFDVLAYAPAQLAQASPAGRAGLPSVSEPRPKGGREQKGGVDRVPPLEHVGRNPLRVRPDRVEDDFVVAVVEHRIAGIEAEHEEIGRASCRERVLLGV